MAGISQHRLDRRRDILSEKIKHLLEVTTEMLRPEGTRPPLTDQKTSGEALVFWRKHRFDAIGAEVLANRPAADVAELDAWLARHPDPELAGLL